MTTADGKLFIVHTKTQHKCLVSQLKAMVGLSVKEISSSQSMDKQENKYSKHKSAQQIML
jgi:hypothetical protein